MCASLLLFSSVKLRDVVFSLRDLQPVLNRIEPKLLQLIHVHEKRGEDSNLDMDDHMEMPLHSECGNNLSVARDRIDPTWLGTE